MAERTTKTIDEQFHRLESRIGRLEQAIEGRFTRIAERFTRQDLLLTEILNEVKKA